MVTYQDEGKYITFTCQNYVGYFIVVDSTLIHLKIDSEIGSSEYIITNDNRYTLCVLADTIENNKNIYKDMIKIIEQIKLDYNLNTIN